MTENKGQRKQFYFLRHGQTDWNFARLMQGISDIPLNEEGKKQAQQVSRIISSLEGIDVIYHSGLSRARQTMEIACTSHISIPRYEERSIQERHFGEWEGKNVSFNHQEIKKECPPQGESFDLFKERVKGGIDRILTHTLPLCVSHGGVYYALCELFSINSEEYPPLKNGELVYFSENYGNWSLSFISSNSSALSL